jgi:hypothetical protein
MSSSIRSILLKHTCLVGAPPQLPSRNIPLRFTRPCPTPSEMDHMLGLFLAMSPAAQGWVLGRDFDYYSGPGRMWPAEEQTYAATQDYLRNAK